MRFTPNPLRWGRIATSLLICIVVFYTLEPRKRAWSCKTLASCLGGRPHVYKHWNGDGAPVDFAIGQNEKTLHDGTVFYHRRIVGTSPETLILVLGGKDERAWSKDDLSTRRSVYDFVDLLIGTGLDFSTVSLGILTSTQAGFDAAKKATAPLPFARIAIFYREAHGSATIEFEYEEDRHRADGIQHRRRAAISRARNYLMSRSLQDEEHVLWVDADIVEFSEGIVQTMIGHAQQREDVGIITARCSQATTNNYDKNAWAINRHEPLLMGPVADDAQEDAVQRLVETRTYVDELIEGTKDNHIVSLDSVGGTILYMRASLIRNGVYFPTSNVVGTTWTHEGWIGIETEGICYVARRAGGGGCFVLGGNHHVRHADQS
ncbi:glycosyltransferase family 62 protein [Whalleya microplaca]|nr:glycosyltransferase family 62 protein [Whalleya microplaca]